MSIFELLNLFRILIKMLGLKKEQFLLTKKLELPKMLLKLKSEMLWREL